MSDQDLIEVPQKKALLYQGNFLEYHRDEVLLPNGKTSSREYLHHPGAVAAVPILDNGEIVLVRQFRYPTNSVLLELPAGKLEPGEQPEESLRRELIEEIGYQAGKIKHLISVWTSPGFTDEIIHLYLATGLRPCPGEADSDEFLELVTMTKAELLSHLKSPGIIDGKTALTLAILELNNLW